MGESLQLIIGIDVGLTCTGVAYWDSLDKKITVINEWPEGKPTTSSTERTNTVQSDEQTKGNSKVVTEASNEGKPTTSAERTNNNKVVTETSNEGKSTTASIEHTTFQNGEQTKGSSKVVTEVSNEGKPTTPSRTNTLQSNEQTKGNNEVTTNATTNAKPPRQGYCNEHKVATAIAYPTSGPPLWGFPGKYAESGTDVKEYFKLYLDDIIRQQRPGSTLKGVQNSYADFLSALREYLESELENKYKSEKYERPDLWKSAELKYIFSIPTVWLDLPWVIERFKESIGRSGFGSNDKVKRSWEIGLNEAAAACVWFLDYDSNREHPERNDTSAVIVCDAGGGTTDITAMTAQKKDGSDKVHIDQLTPVHGEDIGSVRIDDAFEELVKPRLHKIDYRQSTTNTSLFEPDAAARTMARRSFQDLKHQFGKENFDLGSYPIPVPGLPSSFNDREAGIKNGAMTFTQEEIKKLFDKQVRRMLKLLDAQIEGLTINHKHMQVSALYLCGGLGSSEYVKKCVEEHYKTDPESGRRRYSNIREMKILGAPTIEPSEAQLAVCNGLVKGHVEHFSDKPEDGRPDDRPVLRCCLDWGVVHNERYNKEKHKGQTTREIDGENYAIDRIDWFIHRGDRIEDKDYIHRFSRTYTGGEPNRTWKDTVVIAKCPLGFKPPTSLWPDGKANVASATIACIVESTLPPITKEMKDVKIRRPWYKPWGPGNITIFYEIRLIFELSDTLVEVWFEGEKRGSGVVEWTGETPEQDMERRGQSMRPRNEGKVTKAEGPKRQANSKSWSFLPGSRSSS
ncbi:hypothetical protein K440DRAFT_239149 [Wilcoxina mikolae CBS 423.85]|nr:hypothetical protein K440DRAFT_239149 [Wilcoxina mikolae CBS 423.85]